MPSVLLSEWDLAIAEAEGKRRQDDNLAAGRPGTYGAPNAGPASEEMHRIGAIGELAVAILFGFPRSAVFRDLIPVGGSRDMPGQIDVKSRRARPGDRWCMIVRPGEDRTKRFVSVVVDGRKVTIEGWMPGYEAMVEEYWATWLPRPAYAVHPRRLRPIGELEVLLMKEGTHPQMTYEGIARVAHEANRAYCATIGDFSQPAWDAAPDWQKDSARQGVIFRQAHPEASAADVHENWTRQKAADGWKFGPVKDPTKKEHPCMVPFHELPAEQQAKDRLFSAVVRALLPQDGG